jgi:hypothetical protein
MVSGQRMVRGLSSNNIQGREALCGLVDGRGTLVRTSALLMHGCITAAWLLYCTTTGGQGCPSAVVGDTLHRWQARAGVPAHQHSSMRAHQSDSAARPSEAHLATCVLGCERCDWIGGASSVGSVAALRDVGGHSAHRALVLLQEAALAQGIEEKGCADCGPCCLASQLALKQGDVQAAAIGTKEACRGVGRINALDRDVQGLGSGKGT